MKALILAAGYATRLYPLTKKCPKPLLHVNKRPLIDYIIDKLNPIEEINEIIVVTNSRFLAHFKKWARGLKLKKKLTLVDDLTFCEDDRRGAVGDMHFAIKSKKISDDLLVIGGDNLFDGDLEELLAFAEQRDQSAVIGVYDIREKSKASKYGVIRLNNKNRVIDFKEKPARPSSSLVAMCLYYFPKEKLSLIKQYMKEKSNKHDATGFYIDWLRRKEPIYGYVYSGRWYDIGDAKFYHTAKKAFKKTGRRMN